MTMAPDEDLLKAAIARLKADLVLLDLVGGRIFDRVPEKVAGQPGVAYPYISIGPTSILPGDVDCIDGVEVTIQFDAWSQGNGDAYGASECRRVIEAIRKSLNEAELSLADNALVTLKLELARVLREPDGITSHGVIQFTAIVETA